MSFTSNESRRITMQAISEAINKLSNEDQRNIFALMGKEDDAPEVWGPVAAIWLASLKISQQMKEVENLRTAVELLKNEVKSMPDSLKTANDVLDVNIHNNLRAFGAGVKKHFPAAISEALAGPLDEAVQRVRFKIGLNAFIMWGMSGLAIAILGVAVGFIIAR